MAVTMITWTTTIVATATAVRVIHVTKPRVKSYLLKFLPHKECTASSLLLTLRLSASGREDINGSVGVQDRASRYGARQRIT
jgi:hypothetical protein